MTAKWETLSLGTGNESMRLVDKDGKIIATMTQLRGEWYLAMETGLHRYVSKEALIKVLFREHPGLVGDLL